MAKKKKKGLDFKTMDKDAETLNEIIDTIDLTHIKAIAAGTELLRDKKTKRIQYSKLKDDPDFQQKYIHTIADEYDKALRENDNIKLKDKFKISAITEALYGINREELLAKIAKLGHRLTHRYYLRELAPELSENVRTRYRPVIYRDITNKKHVKQVVEHIPGASEHINPDLMNPEQAKITLMQYHADGTFSPKNHIPPNAIYRKKKGKKKKKKK